MENILQTDLSLLKDATEASALYYYSLQSKHSTGKHSVNLEGCWTGYQVLSFEILMFIKENLTY